MHNNHRPTVSVVIPTYNRMKVLTRSTESVLNQTYQDFEIIIVDDGSKDNTEEVTQELQKLDKRIISIRHEKNRGGSAARNTGIKAAKGKFIAFQDSDDEWLPEKLKKQMQAFQNTSSEVGVVYTGFWKIYNNNKMYIPSLKIKKSAGFIHEALLEGNFITTQSAIVRAECLQKAGMFNETLPRFQDWELWIRISKHYQFEFINEPLLNAFVSSDSISINHRAEIMAYKIILNDHYDNFRSAGHKVLADKLYTAGNALCKYEDIGEGRKYILRAIRVMPRAKYFIALFMSLLSRKVYCDITKVKRIFLPVQE